MAQHDIHNLLNGAIGRNISAISSSTTTNGNIIDTQGYGAVEAFLLTGAYTDGTYVLSWSVGDDSGLSDGAAPSSDDVIGSASLAAANGVKRLGYVGNKRYVRPVITSTGVTSGATVGVLVVRGKPNVGPAAAN